MLFGSYVGGESKHSNCGFVPLLSSPSLHVWGEESTPLARLSQVGTTGNHTMPTRKGSGAIRAIASFYMVLTLPLKTPNQMDQRSGLEGLSCVTGLFHCKTAGVWCKSVEMQQLVSAYTQKG